jgi:hypothetical protein
VERSVLRLDVRCRVSLYFNAVRRWPEERPEHRVRRFVQANAGRCILRGNRRRERVRWELGRRCRLREQHGLGRVRVARREGLVNAMFRAG